MGVGGAQGCGKPGYPNMKPQRPNSLTRGPHHPGTTDTCLGSLNSEALQPCRPRSMSSRAARPHSVPGALWLWQVAAKSCRPALSAFKLALENWLRRPGIMRTKRRELDVVSLCDCMFPRTISPALSVSNRMRSPSPAKIAGSYEHMRKFMKGLNRARLLRMKLDVKPSTTGLALPSGNG